MRIRATALAILTVLLVLSATVLVHDLAGLRAQAPERPPTAVPGAAPDERTPAAPKQARPAVRQNDAGLPARVADMRDAILEAVRSGSLDDLRIAVELNELKPAIGSGGAGDPIGRLRAMSADGEGRDVLNALDAILAAGWVAVPLGPDIENNRIYVWPRFAETSLAALSPEDRAELETMVSPEAAAAMIAGGAYTHWRLGIGADGSWHFLRK